MSVSKVLQLPDLARQLAASRQDGLKIAHCHGCFDLMHIGHIRHLCRFQLQTPPDTPISLPPRSSSKDTCSGW
jgi:hypothetical protein